MLNNYNILLILWHVCFIFTKHKYPDSDIILDLNSDN